MQLSIPGTAKFVFLSLFCFKVEFFNSSIYTNHQSNSIPPSFKSFGIFSQSTPSSCLQMHQLVHKKIGWFLSFFAAADLVAGSRPNGQNTWIKQSQKVGNDWLGSSNYGYYDGWHGWYMLLPSNPSSKFIIVSYSTLDESESGSMIRFYHWWARH